MNISDFKPRQTVSYMPPYPGPIEHGIVKSVTDRFVFVKFYPQLDNFGWDGTVSQACLPEYLLPREPTQTEIDRFLKLDDTKGFELPKQIVYDLLSQVTKKD